MPLIAYLDTCVVSGLAKEDVTGEELSALLQILQAQKSGVVSLVTSSVTKEEIDHIPVTHRAKHLIIYNLLADVPVARAFQQDKTPGLMPWDLGMRLHPMLAQLITALPDEADARHIYQAAQNAAQYFITIDSRTILSRRDQIERIAKIKSVNPQEFGIILSRAAPTHA